jgi:hypothetical protein
MPGDSTGLALLETLAKVSYAPCYCMGSQSRRNGQYAYLVPERAVHRALCQPAALHVAGLPNYRIAHRCLQEEKCTISKGSDLVILTSRAY